MLLKNFDIKAKLQKWQIMFQKFFIIKPLNMDQVYFKRNIINKNKVKILKWKESN